MSAITFRINGKLFEVGANDVTPETKLVDFIRDVAKLKGTKYQCREGGCGVCVVKVTTKNETKSVNSCLTPVLTCEGWDIRTIEDMGDNKSGYTNLQKRFAAMGGTQCGFCTPGVLNAFSSLIDGEQKGCIDLGMADIEDALDGNICRCTGYRPILDAFKSFAKDAPQELKEKCGDIEQCFQCPLKKVNIPRCEALLENKESLFVNFKDGKEWIRATSLDKLYQVFSKNGHCKIVAGNTGIGIYKNLESNDIKTFVEIGSIPELLKCQETKEGLSLGGGVTITNTISALNSCKLEYGKIIAKHFSLRVGNIHVRNVATLGGNLMLKHINKSFPSDIFILFEAVGAMVCVGCVKTGAQSIHSLVDWLSFDMTQKVVLSITLPHQENCILKAFKICPRYQNSKGYINAAFLIRLDESQRVVQKPRVVFGGINPEFVHASATEDFLTGKILNSPDVLKNALIILESELNPVKDITGGSSNYKKSLAKSLLFKVFLDLLDKSEGSGQSRGLCSGRQSYVKDTNDGVLYKGIPKLEALLQCSGEAQYTNDVQKMDGELFGAFVLSTVGNCTLKSIDCSEALKIPGVVKFITAEDIPGMNNYMVWDTQPEEVFATSKIHYAGQPLGLILAESREFAVSAVKKVKVQYEDKERPILTLRQALDKAEKEGTLEELTTKIMISPETGEKNGIVETIKGEFQIGSQAHFQMEPHSTLCIPAEDSLTVYTATQWIDKAQASISKILAISVNNITIIVSRLGGGFGGKSARSGHVSGACAVASHVTKRPVRVILDLETHLRMMGKRLPYHISYEVGFDKTGKIHKLNLKAYCDAGWSPNEETTYMFRNNIQNCYSAIGWNILTGRGLTNTPANTFCRGPGHIQAVAVIETVMEHVAFHLKKDPVEVRIVNFLKTGDHLLFPEIPYEEENPIHDLLTRFKKETNYDIRRKDVKQFNKENRWMKQGLALVPIRFPNHYIGGAYQVWIGIHHIDGSVVISQGGIEMGQGLNTKVAQVVAEKLKIPISKIRVKHTSNLVALNSCITAAGTTSEACCFAAAKASEILLVRMSPIRQELGDEAPWEKVVETCHKRAIDLTSTYMNQSHRDGLKGYDLWSLILTQVEVDVLTGEYKITKVDFHIDGSRSINPELDLGQVEGALIFGFGLWTTEKVIHDPETGSLLTASSWDYKPPQSKDIPQDFNVTMFTQDEAKYGNGVLGSKGPGEPAICSGVSVLLALRHAITSARMDVGNKEWFQIDGPATPEDVFSLCLTSSGSFSI